MEKLKDDTDDEHDAGEEAVTEGDSSEVARGHKAEVSVLVTLSEGSSQANKYTKNTVTSPH